jgi:hypothetical protein
VFANADVVSLIHKITANITVAVITIVLFIDSSVLSVINPD